ncbi:hypothetical protein QFC22_004427 [Naganishia vaughanmartiniae]|uniref:Uncharacterized protein n=1 Tax=Naganishia vaughanmartiniae TaxID=1424756 RepID=A0ACC2X130_9TREE|nr:hypothetical protein QFC22_004427 [Naganishia vaughanmartiniae]
MLANLLPSIGGNGEADSQNYQSPHHAQHPRQTTHAHPQHTNLFVAQDGPTGMPSFEELVITEQRDSIECDMEDADQDEQAEESTRKHETENQSSRRRRSVAFLEGSSAKQAVRQRDGEFVSSTPNNSGKPPKDSSSPSSSSSSRTLSSQKGNTAAEASETDPLLPSKKDSKATKPGDDLDYDPMKDPEEWARIREGSMGMAPKQELMINLACLAHPPRVSSATALTSDLPNDYGATDMLKDIWHSPRHQNPQTLQTENQHDGTEWGVPDFEFDLDRYVPLSPADKWMLDVQRRMAADRKRSQEGQVGGNHTRDELPHGPVGGLPAGGGGNEGGVGSPANGSDSTEPTKPNKEPGPHSRPDIGREGGADEDARPGEIDPRLCKKDPRVQAAAAKLTMTMTLCMGILSALSTGFWGAVSDRMGRTLVMAVTLVGFATSDIILIITATYPHRVPFGYRFILLGPLIDGFCGGFSTIQATNNAYLSDTTPDGSRAKVFSRFGGILMIGFSLGPVIGSSLIKATGDILSVFYVSATLSSVFALFVIFILPESLSSEARHALGRVAKAKALREARLEQEERDWEDNGSTEEPDDGADANASGWSRMSGVTTTSTRSRRQLQGRLRRLRRRLFSFLAPLAMFLPKDRVGSDGLSQKGSSGKDWNLTFLILSSFCMSTLMALMQLKGQYLIYSYGWTSTELGPYMTLMGVCRALVLVVLLPLVVKIFKPKIKQADADAAQTAQMTPYQGQGILRSPQNLADSKFDLWILRASLVADMLAYLGMSFVIPAPGFVFFTCLVCLGSCSNAVTNSLALNLIDSSREAGKLFGALSVVSACASSFFGPLLFAMIYAHTVGVYAPAIFAVAVAVVVIAQALLMGVRLPREYPGLAKDDPNRVERGRTRRTKRVKSSSSITI